MADPEAGYQRMTGICTKTAFGLINKSLNIQLESSKYIMLNKNGECASLGSILTKLVNQNSSISFRNKQSHQQSALQSARIILDEKVHPDEINDDYVIIQNEQCLKGMHRTKV